MQVGIYAEVMRRVGEVEVVTIGDSIGDHAELPGIESINLPVTGVGNTTESKELTNYPGG